MLKSVMLKNTSIVTFMVLLVGCTSTNFIKNTQSSYEPKNNMTGLVIGSITMKTNGQFPETNISGHPRFNVVADFYDLSSKKKMKIASISNARPVNLFASIPVFIITMVGFQPTLVRYQSQFSKQHGQIFAIELTPGTYAIEGWKLQYDKKEKINDKNIKSFRFNINRNEVKYIGNINYNVLTRKNMNKPVEDVIIEISNKSERDIPLFLNKFRKVSAGDIKVEIL